MKSAFIKNLKKVIGACRHVVSIVSGRKDGPGAGSNFAGRNLAGFSFRNKVLEAADFRLADLRNADLTFADARGAYFGGADLSGAILSGADLENAVMNDAVITGAVLAGARLRRIDARAADFSGSDLSGCCFDGADLRKSRFDGAKLQDASFNRAMLKGSTGLDGVKIRKANILSLVFPLLLLCLLVYTGKIIYLEPYTSFMVERAMEKARTCLRNGEEEKAVEQYELIAAKYSHNRELFTESLFAHAALDTAAGQLESAISKYTHITHTAPDPRRVTLARELRALTEARAGNLPEAAVDLEELVKNIEAEGSLIDVPVPSPIGPFLLADRFRQMRKFRLHLVRFYWQAAEPESASIHLEKLLSEWGRNPRELSAVIVSLERIFDSLPPDAAAGDPPRAVREQARPQVIKTVEDAKVLFEEMISEAGSMYPAFRKWAGDGAALSEALLHRLDPAHET